MVVSVFQLLRLLVFWSLISVGACQWTDSKAYRWYFQQSWIIGCNYVPSTAENTLEMWQAPTFDPTTISRELSWLQQTGMNTVRVFLHHLLWQENPQQFLKRIDTFLSIAQKFHIRIVPVLFDDCWNPVAAPGTQLPPVPHVHNSRWVQCPGLAGLQNSTLQDGLLKNYAQGVINRFANDSRVLFWDLYNEPGNRNIGSYNDPTWKPSLSLKLLQKVFSWARGVAPSQPLTSPVWVGATYDLSAIERFQLDSSDIITFHNYEPLNGFNVTYWPLAQLGRPVLCTEYMARPMGSTFEAILPFAKENNIGALNWGWVNGKTQTIYPWNSWSKNYTHPPALWFHDVLHKNGTPFKQDEVVLIKKLATSVATRSSVATTTEKNIASRHWHSIASWMSVLLATFMAYQDHISL